MGSTQPTAPRDRAVDPVTLASRLFSPAGFLLVLLCFGLPFIAVSCESPVGGVEASYTGFDLASGGQPDVQPPGAADEGIDEPVIGVQPLALLAVVTLLVGAGTALVPLAGLRSLLGTSLAAMAGVLVLVNQLVVRTTLIRWVEKESDPDLLAAAEDFVRHRYGFGVVLFLLALLILGNLAGVVLHAVRGTLVNQPPGRPHPPVGTEPPVV